MQTLDDYNGYDSFENSWTYLHEASKTGNIDVAHYMLTETDLDPNLVSGDKWTPLQVACFYGYFKIVALLISDNRTILNFTTNFEVGSPIEIAKKLAESNEDDESEYDSIECEKNHKKWVELIQDASLMFSSKSKKKSLKKLGNVSKFGSVSSYGTKNIDNSTNQAYFQKGSNCKHLKGSNRTRERRISEKSSSKYSSAFKRDDIGFSGKKLLKDTSSQLIIYFINLLFN